MIEIDEKTVGLWSLQVTNKMDWLASIRELIPNEKYELIQRFRHYNDDKAFESEDEKHWERGTIKGTRNFVLQGFRGVAIGMQVHAIGKLHELLYEGNLKVFLNKLGDMPGVYMKQLSQEEAEKMGL